MTDVTVRIGDREISERTRPYVIAEMSGNHNQSLDRALEIVRAAAENGADAVKLQTYTAATMTLDSDLPHFRIDDPSSLWHGRRLWDLYDEAHTPWEWHRPIMELAAELGIHCFSTPFDETAVDFLEDLGVPAYKIASFELTDHRLVDRVARTGKPMIVSTGMATLAEIDTAVRIAAAAGNDQLVLLKCTSTYPATPENTNVRTIPTMRATFGREVGLSDHTMGVGVAVAAVALGATVIEKHVTLDRADGGVDAAFSMEPSELAMLRREADRAWMSLGGVVFGGTEAEEGSRRFRRSIFVSRAVVAGEPLTEANTAIVRPSDGLDPSWYPIVLGRVAAQDLDVGSPVTWDVLR